MAETVITSVILLISTAPMIIIGMVQYRSKDPVGFWSGKEPPDKGQIADVKAYNRKHGLMWILLGTGCILCFLCGLPFGGLITGCLCMAEVIGGIVAMIVYHKKLDRTYYKKEGDM